jgi:molybdopterin/thiamine biosynthesis adenylyltransferase
MKTKRSKLKLKIPKKIYDEVLADLKRPHPFAYERVGFLSTAISVSEMNEPIIIVTQYHKLSDSDYIKDKSVGARINSESIVEAQQRIYDTGNGCLHVHLHTHNGATHPSSTDSNELPRVVESFCNVDSNIANGILIFSNDSAYAAIKLNGIDYFIEPEIISVIGYPLKFIFDKKPSISSSDMFKRQSFLGKNSELLFEKIKVGIVGYGGGGSHIGQQLAHVGFKNIFVFDNDKIELSNLNRLVGAKYIDVKKGKLKVDIAKRLIKSILPKSRPVCVNDIWQNKTELLNQCDIVIGCVDSYAARRDLEAQCRRHMIPYIDIGMDVHKREDSSNLISGQIILSTPGMPCLHCLGLLTPERLGEEAAKYGNVGGFPQVVWSNGVLASTTVGIVVDLLCNWTMQKDWIVYLEYNGNKGTVTESDLIEFCVSDCNHYPLQETGKPKFRTA